MPLCQAAWRRKSNAKATSPPEYAATKTMTDGDNDVQVAMWPDGMKYTIPTAIVGTLPKTTNKKVEEPIWVGERDGAILEAKWTRKHADE